MADNCGVGEVRRLEWKGRLAGGGGVGEVAGGGIKGQIGRRWGRREEWQAVGVKGRLEGWGGGL